jgi:hypothetical protein
MEEPAPPAWVYKRDGRLVPFEADKISRALFAAAEGLGRADAFLARELADAVVHFLAAEGEGPTPTTAQVAELTAKVVRELGQPALAEAYTEFGSRRVRAAPTPQAEADAERALAAPAAEVVLRFARGAPLREVLPACARSYTLQTVYTRDLVAAQDDGLLTLTGLDHPDELEACVLAPRPADDLTSALRETSGLAGGLVALDGPEYLLVGSGRPEEEAARDVAHALAVGVGPTGLRAVVNLNCATPPPWAGDLAEGPLFAGQRSPPPADDRRRLSDVLRRHLLGPTPLPGRVRIDWHLGEDDFGGSAGPAERLRLLAAAALEGAPLGFAFDRPRRPVALAEGIDRQHPAVLLTVGLHLPRLAALAGMSDPAKFLQRLGSLARLALSAGVQKREYLRRRERGRPQPAADAPAVTSGFLLDRARLLVAPVGLDRLVEAYTGKGLAAGGAALDLGRQVLQRLRDVLRQDGRAAHLDCCLDGPFDFGFAGPPLAPEQVAGLTPWGAAAAVKAQLRAGGGLHGGGEAGTLALFLPADNSVTAEQVTEWLRLAWQQTDVVRLRLARAPAS